MASNQQYHIDRALLAKQLGSNEEHPTFNRSDWQYDVANGDTKLGYWIWVIHNIESANPDDLDDWKL